ncbi:MAG: cation:proton antiporter [Bacteroidales bacterium]
MHDFFNPVSDPILIFTIVLIIVLLIPVLLRKSSIPDIVGLIVAGIIISPHAFNIIPESDTIELFSKVGLLYIMFLAGLEVEFVELRKNSIKAIFFGIATFAIPFLFGYLAGTMLLSLNEIPATLLGIMLASNTLIAFPVASKLGITKTPAVITAISGTIITDTLVLIILAFLTTLISEPENTAFILRFVLYFSLFAFAMFFLIPRISRWFFRTIASDGNLQFLFTLSILFASAYLAELAGAEPIIGAFFAGLALNKLIPASSTLMNRIDFVGHTLFIPFFLISVGMLVNLNILFSAYQPVLYAVLFIALAISSKWIASWLIKLFFRQTKNEMNTIFGLTSARAAATLAIVLIGVDYGVFSNDIFNATILLIMVSSLFSSYITEKAGIKLAIEMSNSSYECPKYETCRILIPIANPENIEKLIDLAILLHKPDRKDPIYPFAIVKDDKEAENSIISNKAIIQNINEQAASANVQVQGITRIDVNIPTAIARISRELNISDIILGWSGKEAKELNKVFSNMLESILNNTFCSIIVSNLPRPLNLTRQVMVFIPKNAEKEIGYVHWTDLMVMLSKELSAPLRFCILSSTGKDMEKAMKNTIKDVSYSFIKYQQWPSFDKIDTSQPETLYVFINARTHTLSYHPGFYELTYSIPRSLKEENILNIYPRQPENHF